MKALKAATLRESRNMLTQKCMGYLSTATVLLDFSALADGQRGGLFCTGSLYNGIGISREEGKNYLYLEKRNTPIFSADKFRMALSEMQLRFF